MASISCDVKVTGVDSLPGTCHKQNGFTLRLPRERQHHRAGIWFPEFTFVSEEAVVIRANEGLGVLSPVASLDPAARPEELRKSRTFIIASRV